MKVVRCASLEEVGSRAAAQGAEILKKVLGAQPTARIFLSTGTSQFATLKALTETPGIDWSRIECFHLDEYCGMSSSHPASFCRYLRERFVEKLPQPPKAFHYVNGEGDSQAECDRLGKLALSAPIDLAFVGIGENGHLAFNDPPADFEIAVPYHVVALDDACRRQQLGEGWFPTFDDVPTHAISMTVWQIMQAKAVIASVPDLRKAQAVKGAVEGPITPEVPASMLQRHEAITLYLDKDSASLLK